MPFAPPLPHGPIEQVLPNVYYVQGTYHMGLLTDIARSMTVVAEGKDLTVINSIRLTAEGERELDALGTVKHVVKLSDFHGIDDPYYVDRYKATLWALPGMTHAGGLTTGREVSEGGELPFSGARLFSFKNGRKPEGVIVKEGGGGVLICCDCLQNWGDFGRSSFIGRTSMKLLGFKGTPNIGVMWRKVVEDKNGPSLASDFERIFEQPFSHMLSGHGYPLKDTAKADLAKALRAFYPDAKL